jgi:hypothetical protein
LTCTSDESVRSTSALHIEARRAARGHPISLTAASRPPSRPAGSIAGVPTMRDPQGGSTSGPLSAMSGTTSLPSLIGRPQTMQVFVVSVSVMPSSSIIFSCGTWRPLGSRWCSCHSYEPSSPFQRREVLCFLELPWSARSPPRSDRLPDDCIDQRHAETKAAPLR